MKHFGIKLLVVAALALLALTRLQAQDTTLTVYGKNFGDCPFSS